MTIRTLAPLVLAVAVPAAAAAQPAAPAAAPIAVETAPAPRGPDRSGWTLEASVGAGGLWQAAGDGDARAVLSGINASLGGFVTGSTALTLRLAGVAYMEETMDHESVRRSVGFFGPTVQHYLNDRVFLGGGLGIGVTSRSTEDAGVAADLRVGYHLLVGRYGGVHVAAELTPAWFDSGETVGFGVQLGAQLF